MRNITLIAGLLIGFFALAQTGPKATFEKKAMQFEDIKEGKTLEFYYYFKNTGNAPLKLHSVKPTCGCTVAEFPKYEIKPGQRDSIKVSFDTKDRSGYNAKGVNIVSNAGDINLVFEVNVIPLAGKKE
jgi:hypothetical protein